MGLSNGPAPVTVFLSGSLYPAAFCFRILNESMVKFEFGKGHCPKHDAFPNAAWLRKRQMKTFLKVPRSI